MYNTNVKRPRNFFYGDSGLVLSARNFDVVADHNGGEL